MIDFKAIRQAYDLRELIPQHLGVAKSRDDMYPCPFHQESQPSFKVYEHRYQCFGSCDATGDVTDWMVNYMGINRNDFLKKELDLPDAVIIKRRQEYLERKVQRLADEAEKIKQELEALRKSEVWEQYHEGMTTNDRQVWEYRGVPGWYQDFMKLGVTTQSWYFNHETFEAKSLTIPMYDRDRNVGAIKHRLLSFPEDAGKYRSVPTQVPPPLFLANPEADNRSTCYLLEGEIKAAVFYTRLAMPNALVVGTPSKMITEAQAGQLEDVERFVYIPDPDVESDVKNKVWSRLNGREKDFYVLELLDKPDDLILEMDMSKEQLRKLVSNARKI